MLSISSRHLLWVVSLGAMHLAQAESSQARQSLDILNQLDEVRAELQSLRGELEVNQHKIQQLEQQQRDFYNDLDQRITTMSASKTPAPAVIVPPPASTPAPAVSPGAYSGSGGMPSAAPTVAPGAAANAVPLAPITSAPAIDTTAAVASVNNAGGDLAAYQAAYQLLQNKQYTEASAAFNTYLQAYPQGEYVANVDYWLGEIYLIQQNYPQAEQAFSKVVNQYPAHQKAADAMLKLGYVYEASGDPAKALATLEKVQQQYPDTAVAHLAQTKAMQIQQRQI